MGLLCGQTYSFFCYSRGPEMSQSLTQSASLVTGGSGRRHSRFKTSYRRRLRGGDILRALDGEGEGDLVSQVNQATVLSGVRSAPSLQEGSKRRASSSRPPQEQTSEGLNQNNWPRLTNLTEGQYACNPECSQLGCVKHAE